MEKILIVDDSFTSRMYIRKCLEMSGTTFKTIVEASNGQEALKKLRTDDVELIISDVNMPVMCGFTFLRNLKEIPELAAIPVIFITSLASDGRSENLKELGAFEVLKKPLTPILLQQALKKMEPEQTNTGWGA